MIPKNIVRIVFSLEGITSDQRKNFEETQNQNPDWKQLIFTDDSAREFVVENYDSRMLDALSKIDPYYGPALSDLLRCLILYKIGGVYIDNKSGFSRPLNEIIRPGDEYIVGQWDNLSGEEFEGTGFHKELMHVEGGEYVNWVLISRSGHPFLRASIERIISNIETYSVKKFGVGKMGTLRTTGPIAMTLAISEILEKSTYRKVRCAREGLLYAADGNGSKHILSSRLHYSHLCHPIVRHPVTGPALPRFFRWLQMPIYIGIAKIKQANRRRIYNSRLQRGKIL